MRATIKDAILNVALVIAIVAAIISVAWLVSPAHGHETNSPAACANCNGARIVPAGAASVPCPTCEGRGTVSDTCPGGVCPLPKPAAKKTVVKQKTVVRTWPKYPSRPAGRTWLYNGGPITAHHLATHPHHAHEHFDAAWLNTLTQAQLIALGSDAHDGRVREKYVVRTAPRGTVAKSRVTVQSNCPGGVCPSTQSSSATTVRRGLFGRKVYRYRR